MKGAGGWQAGRAEGRQRAEQQQAGRAGGWQAESAERRWMGRAERQRRGKRFLLLLLVVMWVFFDPPGGWIWGYAGGRPAEEFAELPGQDFREIDRFLQEGDYAGGEAFSFSELVKELMEGNARAAGRRILSGVRQSLLLEAARGEKLAGELLALGVVGAVFANFSGIFNGGQISETAFLMTYLLAFSAAAAAFFDSVEVVKAVLIRQTEFMKVLLPSYFLAAAWAGGGLSAASWMELLLFLISAAQELYLRLLLPLGRVYLLLSLAGNMAKENMLSRLTGLLYEAVQWGSRSLLGIVMGFQLIQGIVLPYADAARTAGMQRLLQMIPGVGDGAGAAAKMLLGSGTLIKNTMGAAAVVVLFTVSLVPVLKLAVLLFLYRAVAALLQPVGDKRLVACICGVADGQKLLLGMTVSALLLFVVTIALICVGTNVAFLA